MNDTKMLQAIADSISLLRKEIHDGLKDVNERMNKGFKEVNNRIDKLGKSLAYMEDDAVTWEAHDKLSKRISKIEKKLVSN